MALVQASSAGAFVELDICNSPESLARLLDSQRELFHSQVDQLQRLVVTQCKLTGVNPLSQEMAAGALSIKIGKRPRDLLNPKAIKYLQSIFSIKDIIGKKETREISALCGVTATQVREYITGQRSRVRKLVLLSREIATRSDASKALTDGGSSTADQILPATEAAPMNAVVDLRIAGECTQVPGNSMNLNPGECTQVPGNSINLSPGEYTQVPGNSTNLNPGECTQAPGNSIILNPGECTRVPGNSGNPSTVQVSQQDPVNSTELKTIAEGPLCSLQEETIPGIESDEKKFLENIFNLMRKEETFSGQVKLMEWIIQIHNPAALNWFVTKGGLAILATWLSEAAVEEQTTALLVILKALCHLPLHKALPVQMSAILQTVNRLRFYRTSGISNRARVLLSRWSILFVRSQAMKKPSIINPKDARKDLLRKQRISGIPSNKSWQSDIDIIPEDILALQSGSTENSRKQAEPRKGLKLISASGDESSKKHARSVSSPKNKERRKVLLVEQPDRRTAGRSVQVARAVPSNHSRPMSADDIQKAKMRAMFMQDKYGTTRTDASSAGDNHQAQKLEDHKASPPPPPPAPQATNRLPSSRIVVPQLPQPRVDKPLAAPATTETSSPDLKLEAMSSIDPKPSSASREQFWEKLKRDRIEWRTPSEMKINCVWKVGGGENSKEVEVQTQRIRREKETFYPNVQLIPLNPKDPWDTEMDFDDSLTPEIPTEQPPDAGGDGSSCCSPRDTVLIEDAPATTTPSAPPVVGGGNVAPEPDLELLAVLLKNPELVFALTSGQGMGMSKEETVALLDTLKRSGVGLNGMLNGPVDGGGGSNEKYKEPEHPTTSLPSPTPPSDHTRSGWRSEFTTPATPVLQPHFTGNPTAVALKNQSPVLGLPPSTPTTILSMPQLTVTINPATQHHIPALNFLTQRPPAPGPYQYPLQQSSNPEPISSSKHYPVSNAPVFSHNPSTLHSQPHLIQTQLRPQTSPLVEASSYQPKIPTWPPNGVGRRDSTPASSWVGSKGFVEVPAPNSHSFPTNQSNYSLYPNRPMQQPFVYPGHTAERNGVIDRSELERWSPEGSPARSPESRYGRSFPEGRREFGRDQRPEFSGQWNSGRRDRDRDRDRDRYRSGGGRRWRDKDRDRDRRR